MSRFRIHHVTGFHYAGEVSASYNEARMLPVTSPSQLVLQSSLDIVPASSQHGYIDYWGTRVSSFEVLTPHTDLTLSATSVVEVRPALNDRHSSTWEELAPGAINGMDLVEQIGQTDHTAPPDDVAALAREIATSGLDPCEAALAICRRIGESVEYMPGVTGVHSTGAEAWAEKKGVCQDITHIALGALRAAGIPARYVSGYLHPQVDPVLGEPVVGESHAWVEWWCGRWVGYDPTNQVEICDRHVLVGRGRDYNDVPPLRGVFAGRSGSRLFVSVEITREA